MFVIASELLLLVPVPSARCHQLTIRYVLSALSCQLIVRIVRLIRFCDLLLFALIRLGAGAALLFVLVVVLALTLLAAIS